MDLLDPRSIAESLIGIGAVIHLAGLDASDCLANPVLAVEVNTKGAYHLMRCATQAGVRRVIYLSTFHVYGRCATGIVTEATTPDPVHPYSITRLAAEQWVRHGVPSSEIDTVVLRSSNGFGYPMDGMIKRWDLVFNDCCRQAVANRRIVLKSSGNESRDFITLHDMARAMEYFLLRPLGSWGHDVYNLGGQCEMTVLEAARRVASVYERIYPGSQVAVSVNSEPEVRKENRRFTYNIDKLIGTGFRLEGNMDWEIEQTIRKCIQNARIA